MQVDTQAIFIPEEDRWISILELNENERFLEFYHSMLQLYEAVCAQNNNYVAHQVCRLIDERQLLYCIQNQCKKLILFKNCWRFFYNVLENILTCVILYLAFKKEYSILNWNKFLN